MNVCRPIKKEEPKKLQVHAKDVKVYVAADLLSEDLFQGTDSLEEDDEN